MSIHGKFNPLNFVFGRSANGFGFFLLFSVLSAPLYAQESFDFATINTDQGLSTGTVNCSFQDSRGFMWFGTVDGLNRYDGYGMKTYKNDPADTTSMVGNSVRVIMEDKDGKLWIGTDNGLSVYSWQNDQFQNFRHDPDDPASLPASGIRDLHLTESGKLLIATNGAGLVVYDREADTFKPFDFIDSRYDQAVNNEVYSIVHDRGDYYWVGANSGTLDRINIQTGALERITFDPDYNINADRQPLFKDDFGHIWIGTDGLGLYRYDPAAREFMHFEYNALTPDGITSGIITAFYQDDQRRIWIGTDGDGINMYDPKTQSFSYIRNDPFDDKSLSSDAIYDIYQGDSEIIWVSTFRGGVNSYSPYRYKFEHYTQVPGKENSLSFSSVLGILQDSKGNIWLGTDGGGLNLFDPETESFEHFRYSPTNENSISGDVIKAIYEDRFGLLWLGTYAAGVTVYDQENGEFTRINHDPEDPTSLSDDNVWGFMEDEEGQLWVAVLGGGLDLYNREDGTFTNYSHDDNDPTSLSSDVVNILFQDDHNNFWVGTVSSGINLFNKESGTFKRYESDPSDSLGLPGNEIRTITQDSKGTLWVGTMNGMATYDYEKDRFMTHEVTNQLHNKAVNGILEDDQGNLWVSTNRGLCKVNLQTFEVTAYSKAEGLQGNEFNYTASEKTRDGKMLFGGLKGFNYFDPAEIRRNPDTPRVAITGLSIFDEPVDIGEEFDGRRILENSIGSTESLTLTHKENIFSIAFSALDFTAPGLNRYEYILEGFDEHWTRVNASKRQATYMNLPPDTYTFKVKGTNNDGVWSEEVATLKIVVLSPWWATLWFKFLVAVIIIAAAYAIYRWRTEQIKNQRKLLQQKVDEATEEAHHRNQALEAQSEKLQQAIEETNYVVQQAAESGNFQARIDTAEKTGEWKALGESINQLFDSVMQPFNIVNRIVNNMASGDLTDRYRSEAKGDSLELANNLNAAMDSLCELLAEIKESSENISAASNEMLATSEEMNVSTDEIANVTDEISRGAQQQVAKTDESSNLIEGILKSSNENRDQADAINVTAQDGVAKSESGRKQVEDLNAIMNEVLAYAKKSDESIAALTHRSKEIAGILNIIKDVARQTNLLALNASIEAAQAGDAGRGFAVVAEEIRKLAENSKSSAADIEQLVIDVQKDTRSAADLISGMNKSIDQGGQATSESLSTFNEIAEFYRATLEKSKMIVTATHKQSEDIGHVLKTIEGVVVIAEETATSTEETASSSSQLSAGMASFTEQNKEVSRTAEGLIEKVRKFKLINEGE